jgi:hypothetical protein
MRSFLLKEKSPIVKWGMIPQNTFFEGKVPENYNLAICPSDNYIVIDVDKHDNKNGFDNIPFDLLKELNNTLNYNTKNNGKHYWFKYTGNKPLANKTSGLGIDLRTNKGYVVFYPKTDIRKQLHLINNTSNALNKWVESMFSYK